MKAEKRLYYVFASSVCLVLFMILGYIAKFYEATLLTIDQPIQQWIRQTITPQKTDFFIWLTKFGSAATLAFLLLIVVVLCIKKKFVTEAIWLTVNTALIAGLSNYLIKFLFDRSRPALEHLVVETHSSFPSGHAMGSMLFYGTLIMLLHRFVENKNIRLIVQIGLGLLILLIGISRLYLGVHYPTDILGGYLLGAAWILGTYPIYQKQRIVLTFKGIQK